MTGHLLVVATRSPVLVQDMGRPGFAHLGVGRSGAADRAALGLANRLVGNHEGAAALEVLLGGVTLRAEGRAVTLAVTGADLPVTAGGRSSSPGAPVTLLPGEELVLGTATTGLRATVAVRGGVAVDPVLRSRSRDTLAGLGPEPLGAGDLVPIGDDTRSLPGVDHAPSPAPAEPVAIDLVPAPRTEWFTAGALDLLTGVPWSVSPLSDRIGTRLDGPALLRVPARAGEELASEGTVRGAVQVPPHGRPVVLGPDRPVTGGYPVVAVVRDADVDALHQVPPGRAVRFRWRRG